MMPDERSQQDIEMDEATLRLQNTDDARVWARAFRKRYGLIPKDGEIPANESAHAWAEGVMVVWFANAMGVAESFSRKRLFTEDELGALVEMTTALRDSSLSLIYPGVNADELRIKLQGLDPVRFYA